MLEVRLELDQVALGVLEAAPARVEQASPELVRELAAASNALRRRLSLEDVAAQSSVRNVRAMFRSWGVDPSRYRPSAEALLRRVVQGKGLYHVSNVVDVANLGSVETGWPFGCYDRDAIEPPVCFRLGRPGETYQGIGRRTWHLAGRPVLADSAGAFGSPISDSTRTMVGERTSSVLVVIFAPAATEFVGQDLAAALAQLIVRLRKWAGVERVAVSMSGAPAA
jgi:DNA/RNA-binding domain of Phe-tRNA-synthetase-like protein